MLISAKLQTGKRGQKNRADWETSVQDGKARLGL
jgi:hypothetical protein